MGRIVLDVIPTESRNKYKAGKIPVIYTLLWQRQLTMTY